MQSLFLEGLVFSGVALGAIVLLAWWLYVSPLAASVDEARSAPPRASLILALMIGAGTLLISIGGYWDASEHVVTGIVPGGEDFLWPPHLMLYAGFLLSFLVALGGFVALALPNLRIGVRDPRCWVRRNPYIGAVALAAGYGLLSIPGDAIWHELYGLDLTAWSPPHIFLVVASASTPLFAAGLLLRAERRSPAHSVWIGLVAIFYLALVLSEIFLIASLEWEIDVVTGYIAQRPVWLYPVLIGTIGFFVVRLARRLVPLPWTATVTALLYFGWRLALTSLTGAISGAPPRLTLVFVLGAVLLDLVAQRSQRQGVRQAVIEAAAFTAGYAAVALPTIHFFLQAYLPPFTWADHLLTVVLTFIICIGFDRLADWTGGWMLSSRLEDRSTAEASTPSGIAAPA